MHDLAEMGLVIGDYIHHRNQENIPLTRREIAQIIPELVAILKQKTKDRRPRRVNKYRKCLSLTQSNVDYIVNKGANNA